MDQPLDLSQRDNDTNQIVNNYQLPLLVPGNCVQYNPFPVSGVFQSGYPLAQNGFNMAASNNFTDQSYKRLSFSEQERVTGATQSSTKRRRTDDMNSGILYRTVSDNSIPASVDAVDDQQGGSSTLIKPNLRTPNVSPFSSSNSINSYGASPKSTSEEAAERVRTVDVSKLKSPTKEITDEQKRDVIKSIEYMERLPKKRFTARNLSLESSRASRTVTPSDSPVACNDVKIYVSDYSEDSNQSHSSRSSLSVCSTPPIEEIRSEASSRETPMKSRVDFNTLKADVIREIEDEKKRESEGEGESMNQQFHSFLYNSKTGSLPSTYNRMRVAAVEYLLSKSMNPKVKKQTIQQPLHLYQLGRTERPGKLSLLDMVELQVEIGLA